MSSTKPTEPASDEKAPRQRHTDRDRAQEALGIAERKLLAAERKARAAAKAHSFAADAVVPLRSRVDFLRQDPALRPDPEPQAAEVELDDDAQGDE